jgi:high-mobility group nucleosome-binding domain-containing protein 2
MPDQLPTDDPNAPAVRRIRGSRRVIRPGVPGSDPTPQATADAVRAAEDTDALWGASGADSNDAQLKQDVPPHWG